jgi:uncharacterized coiled-coil protein SlyX
LVLILLLLAGCSDQDARSRISALEARATKVEDKTQENFSHVTALEADATMTADQVKKLASKVLSIQMDMSTKIESESPAIVDPASKGYSISRNEYGAFPVIIEDAQPYLDGYKVKIKVGNLTAATMTGIQLELVYGIRDPVFPTYDANLGNDENVKNYYKYWSTVENNKKGRRMLSVDAGKELAPASWTIVEAIIAQSNPEDLGRIEVRVKIAGVKLAMGK